MKNFIKNSAVAVSAALFAFAAISCSGLYGKPEETTVDDSFTSIWSGSSSFDGWASVTVPAEDFTDVPSGSPIMVTVSNGAVWSIAQNVSGWTKIPAVAADSDANSDGFLLTKQSITFSLTGEEMTSVKANGLVVWGSAGSLTGVYYGESDNSGSYTGTFTDQKYTPSSAVKTGATSGGSITFAATEMDDLSAIYDGGTVPVSIYVKYTIDTSLGSSGTLIIKTASEYTDPVTVVSKSVSSDGTYQLSLNNESADLFATYGMVVTGTNIAISQVYYTGIQKVYISKIIVENMPAGITSVAVKDAANSYASFSGDTVISGTTATITANTADGYVAYTTLTNASGTQLYPEVSDGTDTYYPYVGTSTTLNDSLESVSNKINVLPADTGTTVQVLTIVLADDITTSDAPIESVSLSDAE
ncbi:MAG TPA: hypothetical protein DCL73_13505 [Treponema sp.]|nr:hypothetical protein [Treponema sp.]